MWVMVFENATLDGYLCSIAICYCDMRSGLDPPFEANYEQCPAEGKACNGYSKIQEHHDIYKKICINEEYQN